MSRKEHQPLSPVSRFPFAGLLLIGISFVSLWFNRLNYIVYLDHKGYGLRDLIVPLGVWWEYHSTGSGLLLNIFTLGFLSAAIAFLIHWKQSTGLTTTQPAARQELLPGVRVRIDESYWVADLAGRTGVVGDPPPGGEIHEDAVWVNLDVSEWKPGVTDGAEIETEKLHRI